MVLIEAQLGVGMFSTQSRVVEELLGKLASLHNVVTVQAESTRLFDVCNAFVDALEHVQSSSVSAIDTAVFNLIKAGAIPQVPKLERGEIMEFIQKVTFALSSVSRLVILRELHASPMMRATVAILEMSTGISEQTLRRHLNILIDCRLLKRTRIGQTYLYESVPMRLATLTYLWNALNQVGIDT